MQIMILSSSMKGLEKFIKQATEDYQGKCTRIAEYNDKYDEYHVIIEKKLGKDMIYLDWVGGDLAEQPDEFDKPPFKNLEWKNIK